MSWVICSVDNDYEINTDYPHSIRKIETQRIIKESVSNDGYIVCSLNLKQYKKHRIIATQFIPNPNNLPQVDHINHNKQDNRIENLRWVSSSTNNVNRSAANGVEYEYFDEIPADEDDIIEVRDYGKYHFEDLYFANNYFYFDTGINFKKLHINFRPNGSAYTIAYDTNDKQISIYYTKFKKLYGLN